MTLRASAPSTVPPSTVQPSTVPLAAVDQVLARPETCVIDLRSPSEFAQDHLPGAINAPLFGDAGRALVGLLYQRESPQRAFEEGQRLAMQRIRPLVEEVARHANWSLPSGLDFEKRVAEICRGGIAQLESQLQGSAVAAWPERAVVLHCWRGGLRSRSVVHFLRGLGLDRAVGLQGGYKSYRAHVVKALASYQGPKEGPRGEADAAGSGRSGAVVLRGLTGVGKTLVLRRLEALRPGLTIDLEGCAGHRSSLLGMVGLEPCTQKTFDSRLAHRLSELGAARTVVLEGESRKVGDVTLPGPVWDTLQSALHVELVASVERRVEVLVEDYLAVPSALPLLREQLEKVGARMGGGVSTRRRDELLELFDSERWFELVSKLLADYYDPLYRHSEKGRSYSLQISSEDPDRAAEELITWIDSGFPGA